jgi:hypothetical protein
MTRATKPRVTTSRRNPDPATLLASMRISSESVDR